MHPRQVPFHVIAKPIGPVCNLACDYCFYLDKAAIYPDESDWRMPLSTLEEFVKQYVAGQPGPVVSFAWQGGEPTLMGLEFFQKAVEYQKRYLPPGWRVENAFQTNGILLDAKWCEFLRENEFLVGISLDGPEQLHDAFRKDRNGGPTYNRVVSAIQLLQEHGVEYNVLCVVNRLNAQYPEAVYRFLRELGVQFIQFIPLVESMGEGRVSERSVDGPSFGRFLVKVFNEWILHDYGKVFIQTFEDCVSIWAGLGSRLCVFSSTCGRALAMEHNGDVYACDHYVFPQYFLGNIRGKTLREMVDSPNQVAFGWNKTAALPRCCRECEVRFVCNGACPKDRIAMTPDGEPGLNYLCQGYKQFFIYIDPYMREIVHGLKAQLPPDHISARLSRLYHQIWDVGRNDPCPCGSGRKYKRCCGQN